MTAKNVGGRPEHRPSLKDRRVVTLLAGLGVSQEAIAATLGVAKKTMAKHYHEELRDGAAKVEAQLVGNSVQDGERRRCGCAAGVRLPARVPVRLVDLRAAAAGRAAREEGGASAGRRGRAGRGHRMGATFYSNEDDPGDAARRRAPLA